MNLREARETKGWTIREFAKKLEPFYPCRNGRSRANGSLASLVSRWERRDRRVPRKFREKIMEVLECRVDFDPRPTKRFPSCLKLSDEDCQLILGNPLLQESAGKLLADLCEKIRGVLR